MISQETFYRATCDGCGTTPIDTPEAGSFDFIVAQMRSEGWIVYDDGQTCICKSCLLVLQRAMDIKGLIGKVMEMED